MLKSIKTKNFKRLADNHFTFTDGLNIICGENAQGKTTLTQAFMFALFGVKALPGSADKIPTWGQKNCEVEVVFGDYKIVRSLKNCEVFLTGASAATGNSVCSAYIEERITGIDLKGFKMLNWSAQGETAALLTLGAAQLQRDVEKFSGVEFIDEMAKLAGVDLRDLQRDTKLFESKGSEKDLTKQIKTSTKALRQLIKDIDEERVLRDKYQTEKSEIAAKLETAEANNRKAEQTKLKIASVEQSIESSQKHIDDLKSKEAVINQTIEGFGEVVSNAEYQARKDELSQAIKTNALVTKATTDLVEAEKGLEGIEAKIKTDKDVQEMLGIRKKELADRSEALKQSRQQVVECEKLVDGLEQSIASGVCETCGQSIADEETLEKYQTDLADAQTELELASGGKTKAEAAYVEAVESEAKAQQHYEDEYGDWAIKAEHRRAKAAECETFLSENKTVDTDKEAADLDAVLVVRTKSAELCQQLVVLSREMRNTTADRDSAKASLTELKEKTFTITFDAELTAMKQSIKKLETDFNESVAALHDAEIEKGDLQRAIKQLEQDLANELAFREKLDKSKLLEDFIQYLKDSRARFLSSIWSNILSIASSFLMQATNGRITSLMKSDKEGFMFCEEGVFAPIASASGAQRGFIGVSVRLALAKSLRSSCPIVVLDEPTESMSEENAMRLSGSLLGHGQVIMVTHRESDKGTASNVVEL